LIKNRYNKTEFQESFINRHWLVWLKPNSVYSHKHEMSDLIKEWIKKDYPFVCARFDSVKLNTLNLGFCPKQNGTDKPLRVSLKTGFENIASCRPPLLLSEVIEALAEKNFVSLKVLLTNLHSADLSESRVFGSFAWQSITGKQYVNNNSDLDLILNINSIEDACLANDIISEWENRFDKKIDCELKFPNGNCSSIKEFFSTSKQILVKNKDNVEIIFKKEIYDLLLSEHAKKNNVLINNTCRDAMLASHTKHQYETQALRLYKDQASAIQTSIVMKACRALYSELSCYPKPGLVSFYDTGSHSNMNHTTFIKSIGTLYNYFSNITEAVHSNCSFLDLVQIGIGAEDKMFRATNTVNTHKGAIFSMGLLAAATAKTLIDKIPITHSSIRDTLLNTWKGDIEKHVILQNTHGRKAVNKYHVTGIIKEAADGYPVIFDIALPTLIYTIKNTNNWNSSLIQTFFEILSVLNDTNMLYRGGKNALSFAKKEAESFLNSGGVFSENWYNKAETIHKKFIEKNLSPGGCADLLACTIFIYSIGDIK
jgi:triphosphoribosyl-dephospho-CoA synthase